MLRVMPQGMGASRGRSRLGRPSIPQTCPGDRRPHTGHGRPEQDPKTVQGRGRVQRIRFLPDPSPLRWEAGLFSGALSSNPKWTRAAGLQGVNCK